MSEKERDTLQDVITLHVNLALKKGVTAEEAATILTLIAQDITE